MKLKIALVFAFTLCGQLDCGQLACGQTAAPSAPSPLPPAQESQAPLDPALHANVLKLLELSNTRASIVQSQAKVLPEAKTKLMEASGNSVSQEFAEEWGKRMMADVNIDEYMAVVTRVYEKYFSNEDVEELIQIRKDANDKKKPVFSERLSAKFAKVGGEFQGEVIGECSKLGSKQGAKIAQEIGKEHPEWLKTPAQAPDPGAKKE